MKFIKYLFIAFTLIVATSAFAQRMQVKRVSQEPYKSSEGLYYALPKTIIRVEFDVTQNTWIPPLCPKAYEKLFDVHLRREIDGAMVIMNNRDSVETTYTMSNYAVTTRSDADEDQVYQVKMKKKWNKALTYNFNLGEKGLIKGATIKVEDKTFDIISKSIGLLTTVGKLAVGGAALEDSTPSDDPCKDAIDEALSSVKDLIDKRIQLISATGYFAEQATLTLQLVEIDKELKRLLETYFLGKKITKTKRYAFEYTPALNDDCEFEDARMKLIGFDKKQGMSDITVQSDFMNPEPLADKDAKATKELYLSIEPLDRGIVKEVSSSCSVDSKSVEKEPGLAYRIPRDVRVKLVEVDLANTDTKKEGTDKFIAIVPVSQLGVVSHLNRKMDVVTLEYYENLGMIKTLSSELKPILNADQVEAAGGLIDTTAQQLSVSELERLNEENALLEAKKKNMELKSTIEVGSDENEEQ